MKFVAVLLAVAVSVATIVTAFSTQRIADEEPRPDSDYNSTKYYTCDAPIISNVHGRCPEPEDDGIYCFACIDQCRSDVDCGSPQLKCCPTFGCGNGCTDRFCKFH